MKALARFGFLSHGLAVLLLALLLGGCGTSPPAREVALAEPRPQPGMSKSAMKPPEALTAAPRSSTLPPKLAAARPVFDGEWTPRVGKLLDAMEQVESGGRESATSRDGRSIGPLQIQEAYWRDSRVPGQFSDCRRRDYARRVVYGYWKRYCPKALAAEDCEILARTHNGGPRGAQQGWTRAFWLRVQAVMDAAG